MKKAVKVLLFQITWFSCVIGKSSGFDWAGIPGLTLCMIIFLRNKPIKRHRIIFLLCCISTGVWLDTFFVWSGAMQFPEAEGITEYLQPFMIILWTAFATMFPEFDTLFKHRTTLTEFIAGAFGGWVAYWSGSRFHVVEFGDSIILSSLIIAAGWGIIFCALLFLFRCLNNTEFNQVISNNPNHRNGAHYA